MKTTLLTLAALLAVGARAAEMNHDKMRHETAAPVEGAGDSAALHKAMMEGSEKMNSMEMSGNIDRDFVTMMADHHRQALKMSEIELKNGKDAKAKAFARKTIANQKKEIAELERWLSEQPAR